MSLSNKRFEVDDGYNPIEYAYFEDDVKNVFEQIIEKFNRMEIVSGAVIQFEINGIVGKKLAHYPEVKK